MGVKTVIALGLVGVFVFQHEGEIGKSVITPSSIEQIASTNVQKSYDSSLDIAGGNVKEALKVGEKAPNFKLKNALGKQIELSELIKSGPVVLTWYRGGWCPYCNLALKSMQDKLPQFKQAGAQLVALTPELPDRSLTTKEKNKLDFEVLSDLKNNVAREYGIVFNLKPEVAESYENNFGLSKYNGDNSGELPYPATFVIDKNQVIQYVFVNEDYKMRADPEQIITVLKGLKE